eukprot:6205199-Pleurochrysis_carterae.AAC.2
MSAKPAGQPLPALQALRRLQAKKMFWGCLSYTAQTAPRHLLRLSRPSTRMHARTEVRVQTHSLASSRVPERRTKPGSLKAKARSRG